MKRGEIRWYRFQAPDKKRPVLILTRTAILRHLGEVTVAPLTTTIRDIPSEVVLTTEDGVPRDSAVNCDHIQTVSKSRLGPVITALSKEKMQQVSEAIRFALAL
jgi:mRNA interferase MazF